MILTVMNANYAVEYIEAWNSQDFNRVWTCDPGTTLWCSQQLSCEAADVGNLSCVGPKEPVMNECEVICEIFEILNCECEVKEAMILAVMNAIYAIEYVEAWNSQDFNRVWTCDPVTPVRCSYQLSYEATEVGSCSFVGPKEPVTNKCVVIIWNNSNI